MIACCTRDEARTVGRAGRDADEADRGREPFKAQSAGRVLNDVAGIAVLALVAWTTASQAQTGDAAQTAPPPQEPSHPLAATAPAGDGWSDLDAMTFGCVKAGLNAAAREAAKARSQGTYQFSYFRIINDSHHSSYEVHFKSNYPGEADLKYCVAIYCQQGWDPKNTETSVRLVTNERRPTRAAAHRADCSQEHAPAKGRAQR